MIYFSKMSLDNEWNEFDTKVITMHKDNFLVEKILSKLGEQAFIL